MRIFFVASLYFSGFLPERTSRGKLAVLYFKTWKVHDITQHLYQTPL